MSEIALMVKVARLYYEEGKTQADIAKELGITRLSVIELLKQAKSEGIVRFEIVNPQEDFLLLEKALEKKYKLKKVIIASGVGENHAMLLSRLGKSASAYLDNIVKFNDVLGIGWGVHVMETSKHLKHTQNRSITAVPLIGGGNEIHIQYDVNYLTKKFANAFGGESFSLFAPAIVDSKFIRDAIISDSRIIQVIDFWNRLNIVLIGIGVETKETPSTLDFRQTPQLAGLRATGIVGDILSRFYDISGNSVYLEIYDRMICIEPDIMKKAEFVIGVAGGLAKYNAIFGAINGGLINVLITDEEVARKLESA